MHSRRLLHRRRKTRAMSAGHILPVQLCSPDPPQQRTLRRQQRWRAHERWVESGRSSATQGIAALEDTSPSAKPPRIALRDRRRRCRVHLAKPSHLLLMHAHNVGPAPCAVFWDAGSFDRDIGSWGVSTVTTMRLSKCLPPLARSFSSCIEPRGDCV